MDSVEDKQNYLRTEILDKGYNTSDFVEFLIGIKGDEAGNVENWSMEELIQVVSDYKEVKKIKSRRETVQRVPENYNIDVYEEVITCNKQAKTPLSDCHNVEVIVSE
jgi:hypothetical protein